MLKRLQEVINTVKGLNSQEFIDSIVMGVKYVSTNTYLGLLKVRRMMLLQKESLKSAKELKEFYDNGNQKEYEGIEAIVPNEFLVQKRDLGHSIRRNFVMQGYKMPGMIYFDDDKYGSIRYVLGSVKEGDKGLMLRGCIWVYNGKGDVYSYIQDCVEYRRYMKEKYNAASYGLAINLHTDEIEFIDNKKTALYKA